MRIDIGALVIRLTGMVVLTNTIMRIPAYLNYYFKWSEASATRFVALVFLPLLISLIAGGYLSLMPENYIKRLVRASDVLMEEGENGYPLLEVAVVAGIGFYIAIFSLSDLMFHASNYVYLSKMAGSELPLKAYNYPVVISSIVEFGASCLVVMYAPQIIKYMHTRWRKCGGKVEGGNRKVESE